MTQRSAAVAFVALLALTACQTASSNAPAMEGAWASDDGVFVADFAGGRFVSRARQNGAVLAEGNYQVLGDTVQMSWLSTSTQQQRSATCRFLDPSRVLCDQAGATSFQLSRA